MFYIYKDQPQIRKDLVSNIHLVVKGRAIIFVQENSLKVYWEFKEFEDVMEAWEFLKGENRGKETNKQD